MAKPPYYEANYVTKWKMPLALSLLAFVFVWKLSNWYGATTAQDDQEWIDENQVTLAVTLPKNAEETLLIQPATMAKAFVEDELEWKTYTIKSGDNLAICLQQNGLDSKTLQELLSIGRHTHYFKRIYPGQKVRLQITQEGKLQTLHLDVDPLTTLMVHRNKNNVLTSQVKEKPIEKRVAFGGGKILDSFFVAGKHAKLDDALIMELANVFAYDIDFALDIKPNDHFKVLFEEYFVNGVKVGNGPIVAAEFVNGGKLYQAIRYIDDSGQPNYFSPAGQRLKTAFIRTPVQYTHISSHFNLQRRHPILHKIRAHKGVDYAAPHGTPVKAVGQGKVEFVGKKGGYGNTIILQHGAKYTTVYAHLSRFAKSLKAGATIRQGQIIGYVGATGLASGPHLHYEFRINGVHHNPLTVPLPKGEGVAVQSKSHFLAHANDLLQIMNKHEKVLVAASE